MIRYKIVELSTVTDDQMERTVNEWTQAGWNFEHIQFAMREGSKRPAMAFIFFTQETDESEDQRREQNAPIPQEQPHK